MLIELTPPARRRGTKTRAKKPAPLTLQSATFNEGGWVRLTFDRPVNAASVAAMVVTSVVVEDGDTGDRFQGSGTPALFSPTTVQVNLTSTGPTPVPDTRLTAGPATKLAAADDGGAWAGVSNVRLPFP